MDSSSLSSGGRTRGDGMENVDTSLIDTASNTIAKVVLSENAEKKVLEDSSTIPGAFSIYRSTEESRNSVKLPVKVPKGKLFYLVPHLINTKKSFTLRNKEPKFVPFEPYKAAVRIP